MNTSKLNINISWLVNHTNPGIRYLVMRDVIRKESEDPVMIAARNLAHKEGPIAIILNQMESKGYWSKPGPGYNPKYFSTVWTLILLAQLGASVEKDDRVETACMYLLEHNLTAYGQFSMNGLPSGTIDCLQGNLCSAMLELGVEDARLDHAFEWMARTVTGEGIERENQCNQGLHYCASKCGPLFACGYNGRKQCAWGAVKVMAAFSHLPENHRTLLITSAIDRGVEFLLSNDPVKANYPTRNDSKPSVNWWKFGFPVFYVTDLLQLVQALVDLGFEGDARLANAIQYIRSKMDDQGRWSLDYDYNGRTWIDFGKRGEPNPWVSLRAINVLSRVSLQI